MLEKREYKAGETVITAENMNAIQDEIIAHEDRFQEIEGDVVAEVETQEVLLQQIAEALGGKAGGGTSQPLYRHRIKVDCQSGIAFISNGIADNLPTFDVEVECAPRIQFTIYNHSSAGLSYSDAEVRDEINYLPIPGKVFIDYTDEDTERYWFGTFPITEIEAHEQYLRFIISAFNESEEVGGLALYYPVSHQGLEWFEARDTVDEV